MRALPWSAVLCALAFAGCLQASSVQPLDPLAGPPRAPSVVLQDDDQEDRLVFTAVEAGFEWETLGISANPAGTMVRTAGIDAEDEGSAELVPNEFRAPTSSPQQIFAGDFLEFCATGEAVGPVTYSLADLETNTIVFSVTFPTIASCG